MTESTVHTSGLAAAEQSAVRVPIVRVTAEGRAPAQDTLAVEEPLEIRLGFGPLASRTSQTVSLTMRTPGQDLDLAAGFLFTEGIVESRDEILELRSLGPRVGPANRHNVARVDLRPEIEPDLGRLQRHFYTSSSCGVCGKTSLEALETTTGLPPVTSSLRMDAEVLLRLPDLLRERQQVFGRTGGLHAAALFSPDGRLVRIREDVGRHNALDKLIGAQLLRGNLPLANHVVLLSGRASFELLQKAFVAGVPLVAAVGAPSSLAVELAERFGITLIGWLRDGRFSIYSHPERVSQAV